ncbi:GNAT family N-acetyltransferase [Falsirhodobacter deserti]|uniref:GNAT family N-acetyltransferase n=1 Tax=Falsirhodobacter deserti TaxID=1365611 RepID=UPI0013E291CE|nr:GNAT family N-acetyltransferase [Falsirhodobacter deserti]
MSHPLLHGPRLLVGCVHEEGAEKIVAYGGLMPRTRRAAHVGEIFLLVHDDYTGRGYGTCILQALLDLADNWLGLRRVELEVNTDNAPAIHLYIRHGFELEGTKRGDALRDGVLIDTHIMGRLREAPVRQTPTS